MVSTTPTTTGTISDRGGDHHARAGQLEAEGLHQRPQTRRPDRRRRPRPRPTRRSPSTPPRPAPTGAPAAGWHPSARSSASSRVRWATTMVNVLTMMNPPTTSAINAKAVRARVDDGQVVGRVGRPLGRPLRGRLDDGAGADGGRDPRAPARRGCTPAAADTSTSSTCPGRPSTAWAVGRSNRAYVVLATSSMRPMPTVPTTVN